MRKIKMLLLAIIVSVTTSYSQNENFPIIPKPNSIEFKTGTLALSNNLRIEYSDINFENLVYNFLASLNHHSDRKYKLSKKDKFPAIILKLDRKLDIGNEGYAIDIEEDGILLKAPTRQGIFYGLQSIKQLILFTEKESGNTIINCCSITDSPRYEWRGLMLDESRMFFGKEKVKQLIDYMALHKLNIFHWHLTDESGWRIEIKKYPKLTTVGGKGNYFDPNAPVKFYTQEEIVEIVKYAQERFIEIVPEIDMPGHAAAANRAYPEYSGGGSENYPNFTFNPGKEEVYGYLTDILREVKSLFLSDYIHLGGDEVHFGNDAWNTDPKVKELMASQGFENLIEVEKYFIERMADSIAYLGKKVAGWDEIIESDLDNKSTLVMWWRHDKPHLLTEAIEKDFNVVLCPRLPLYFDFVQHESHKFGRKAKGADIGAVYHFPGDDIDCNNKNIKGIQCCVWTDRIQNNKRLDFMIFPRLSAMAEAAWSTDKIKNYQSFTSRLKDMMKLYGRDHIYYFDPFDMDRHPEPEGIPRREAWEIKRE